MAEFLPLFPAHAVERCAATIVFAPQVPDKAFQRIITIAAEVLRKKGFIQGQQPTGFSINAATGQVTAVQGGPMLFASPDGATQILIAADAINIATNQYIRWSGFRGQLSAIFSELEKYYLDLVNINALKVEYWDRFNWSGTWDDFDVRRLLRENDFVAGKAINAQRESHSHSGWFEYEANHRKLVNVNIDIQGIIQTAGNVAPSVSVYTMMQEEARPEFPQYFEQSGVLARLDDIHVGLKSTLDDIILQEMAQKIGLKKGRDK